MSEVLWLAIVVLGGALSLSLLPRLLSRNDYLLGSVKVFLFILYIMVIVYVTLLSRSITRHVKYDFTLFWSYRSALALTGDGPFFGLVILDRDLLQQIILNILLYIPFGYLLPFACARLVRAGRSVSRSRVVGFLLSYPWFVLLAGAALSVATEAVQLFFRLGFFEWDDIFNNTLGCLIGVLLYHLLLRPRAKKAA